MLYLGLVNAAALFGAWKHSRKIKNTVLYIVKLSLLTRNTFLRVFGISCKLWKSKLKWSILDRRCGSAGQGISVHIGLLNVTIYVRSRANVYYGVYSTKCNFELQLCTVRRNWIWFEDCFVSNVEGLGVKRCLGCVYSLRVGSEPGWRLGRLSWTRRGIDQRGLSEKAKVRRDSHALLWLSRFTSNQHWEKDTDNGF